MRAEGVDVAYVATDAPSLSDSAILRRAQAEGRILLTFDKDSGELVFKAGLPAEGGVILCRVSAAGPAQLAEVVLAVLRSRSDWPGHFSVIDSEGLRMTPLPGA